jgi:hypothetical protein
MTRERLVALLAVTALGAGGLAGGLALGLGGPSGAGPHALGPTSASSAASYTYYENVAERFTSAQGVGYRGMMGNGTGPMMGGTGPEGVTGPSGYAWMMGGSAAPGWMAGGSLPASMMGGSRDPGEVMGKLFADAPGPRVSPSEATQLGTSVPPGATVDRAADSVTFNGRSVSFAVLASPSMPAEDFRIGGLTDPTVSVPAGAQIHVELVNADAGMAHGFVVPASGASRSPMPMMSAGTAFPGSALWFLGSPTSAGMHAGTVTFTASTAGSYSYFCPSPATRQKA